MPVRRSVKRKNDAAVRRRRRRKNLVDVSRQGLRDDEIARADNRERMRRASRGQGSYVDKLAYEKMLKRMAK